MLKKLLDLKPRRSGSLARWNLWAFGLPYDRRIDVPLLQHSSHRLTSDQWGEALPQDRDTEDRRPAESRRWRRERPYDE